MIGVLIFPEFQLLDAAGPISAFEIAARFAGNPLALKVIAVTPCVCQLSTVSWPSIWIRSPVIPATMIRLPDASLPQ